MKKNITITWANEKGGVGKTTLCTLFANYLSEKKVPDVCVLDCDRQHSIVDKRKFDSQSCKRIRCLTRSSRLRLTVCSSRHSS